MKPGSFRPILSAMLFVCSVFSSFGTACAVELSVPEIVKKVRPAVVLIEVRTDKGTGAGSGFIVDPSGIVVTNVHVIKEARSVRVKLVSGDVYDRVQVIAFDERRDTALIKIPGFGLPCVSLGNSEQIVEGESVVVLGNPIGILEGSVTTGVVSGIRTTKEGSRVIQTNAAISPGNSGGPMLNQKGEVIGVVSFKLMGTGAENLNFAVPINYARGMLGEKAVLTLAEFNDKLHASAVGTMAAESSQFPRKWKITATGGNVLVRLNGGHLYMESAISSALRAAGGYRTADMTKEGDKYAGVSHVGRPCRYQNWRGKTISKVCSFDHGIEVSLLSPDRIEGVEDTPEKGAKMKCEDCSLDPPGFSRKEPFVLIPD